MQFKKTIIIVLLVGVIIGYLTRALIPSSGKVIQNQSNKDSVSNTIQSQNEVLATFGKNRVVVDAESVTINEGFDTENPLEVKLDSKNYPDLFLPVDKFARIHVEEITDSENPEIKLLYLSRQRPDHGSINDGYFIIVDPIVGKVVDTGWSNFFGRVRLFSSCTSCALPLVEYKTYDRTKGSYTLVNTKHMSSFINLKKELLAINKKETCKINGVTYSLEEAIKSVNDNDKCADGVLGLSNEKPAEDFITIGQYKQIIKNVQRIIDGENIKVYERI